MEGELIRASLPSRERGLKSNNTSVRFVEVYVAPLAGAWIEILSSSIEYSVKFVAPLAGAWIEIANQP